MTTAKTMLVVGAGDSLGSAIARTFAADGFTVCVSRRNGDKLKPLVDEIERLGGKAIAFGSDARREDQVIALIDGIEREVGPLEAAVYNVGGNVRFGILEQIARKLTSVERCVALSDRPVRLSRLTSYANARPTPMIAALPT
jgi:NAD(P)-dependent dehydrogenase (short-subunit alcohol dehydrogenase family)